MTDKQREIGNILSKIADELNITPTMYDKAVESYEAVGKWLGDGIDYTVEIMPQGSMNLGTTVRPINEDAVQVPIRVTIDQVGVMVPLKFEGRRLSRIVCRDTDINANPFLAIILQNIYALFSWDHF